MVIIFIQIDVFNNFTTKSVKLKNQYLNQLSESDRARLQAQQQQREKLLQEQWQKLKEYIEIFGSKNRAKGIVYEKRSYYEGDIDIR